MSLLTLKDFKDHNVDPTSLTDPFDMLLLVADLAAQKYDQEKQASERRRKKAKKGPKLDMPTLPNQPTPPDLPAEFKNRIEAMGGTQWVMVIQKALYKTDLEKNNSRLSMPLGKIINKGFLRVDEREYLAQQNVIEVQFIEPSRKFKRMILRQWDMPKESGKTCSTYVLRTYWNEVSQENGLMPKDVVQVWSFRVGCQQQLCLALVVVSRASEVMAGGVLMN